MPEQTIIVPRDGGYATYLAIYLEWKAGSTSLIYEDDAYLAPVAMAGDPLAHLQAVWSALHPVCWSVPHSCTRPLRPMVDLALGIAPAQDQRLSAKHYWNGWGHPPVREGLLASEIPARIEALRAAGVSGQALFSSAFDMFALWGARLIWRAYEVVALAERQTNLDRAARRFD